MSTTAPPPQFAVGTRVRVTRGCFAGESGAVAGQPEAPAPLVRFDGYGNESNVSASYLEPLPDPRANGSRDPAFKVGDPVSVRDWLYRGQSFRVRRIGEDGRLWLSRPWEDEGWYSVPASMIRHAEDAPEEPPMPAPEFAPGRRVLVDMYDSPVAEPGTIVGRDTEPVQDTWPEKTWWKVKLDRGGWDWTVPQSRMSPAEEPPMDTIDLPPWVAAIASGAALWQQADPMRREVLVQIRGHVPTVTAGRCRDEDAFSVKFLGPMRESAVPHAIDAAIANGDHKPVSIGGTDPESAT